MLSPPPQRRTCRRPRRRPYLSSTAWKSCFGAKQSLRPSPPLPRVPEWPHGRIM
ncbi:unnamed protein product [Dibothriocephalus latus]|uniref:Uncharacterized protein n=1 Tax=Dibothriocephalus latus TaxID=60516 RepID=A0A3P7LZL0_DIBLA|nr:unnamed protein product [Dibothriocephalus latus]